jgi:uncharacterized membrane protein (DUF2068 family)
VNSLTITRQTALVITALGYAALMGIEGVALHQRKQWARWFTIIATSSRIPIEVYEIVRVLHPIGVFVLVASIAIVIYLMRRKDLGSQRRVGHATAQPPRQTARRHRRDAASCGQRHEIGTGP